MLPFKTRTNQIGDLKHKFPPYLALCLLANSALAQVQPKEPIRSQRLLPAPMLKTTATADTTDFSGSWRGVLDANNDPTSAVWTEEFDLQQDANGNLTGTRKTIPKQNPSDWVVWNITGSATGGEFGYQDKSIQSKGNSSLTPCVTTGAMYVSSDGTNFGGNWTAPGCAGGTVSASKITSPTIALMRESLLRVLADAAPEAGAFSLTPTQGAGGSFPTVDFASGVTANSNPATLSITEPNNPSSNGAPSPGGIISEEVVFSSAARQIKDAFRVPAFGMSCYYTTLESDWGTPPFQCSSTKINGVTYNGPAQGPSGLPGTYCSAFLATVRLQGSGVLNDGRYVQSINANIIVVSQIRTSDQTAPVAGLTLARDPIIIPTKNAGVVLNTSSNTPVTETANDTGGAIKSYRLDQYKGAGKSVCSGYNNAIHVAACSSPTANCPGSSVQ